MPRKRLKAPILNGWLAFKERYAFLYRVGLINPLDEGDKFQRDPYWATFRAGKFDFSSIVSHMVWGWLVGPRKAEVMAQAQVYNDAQALNSDEQDVILVGDFNRNPTDSKSYAPLLGIPSMVRIFDYPLRPHIKDSSLYDSMFFQADHVSKYLGEFGIEKFDETMFGNDDKTASLAVSDHRPVWARFSSRSDDD